MLNDTIERIDRFASEREWDQFHSPKNLAASISIEANELLEIFQWTDLSRSEIAENTVRFQEISEEIADVMIYCLRLCSTLNMDPISIINEKIEINNSKYPVEKSIGSSLKSKNLENKGVEK
jgi:NTP pyrophosphatase (non-canonical NTP hydrolase)